MKRDKRNLFSQTIGKFFNIFTSCSRPSTTYTIQNSSYSNLFIIPTPVIIRSNIYLSPRRINRTHLKLPFYPTTFTSIDQTRQKEPATSSSSLSLSSTSNCHSSLTIHQCYSTSTIPSATTTNIELLTNRIDIMEKSSALPPPTSSRCSYIIRPSTPCIFGGDYDDDEEEMNDDEFFVTAGGIIHSCPNIYELSIDNHRKPQSCDHLMFIDQETTLTDDDHNNNNLNCYDTDFDRYSILPRFQTILSSSISTDSINSELELYRERHAIGLSRQYHDDSSPYSASFLPTTWKSDNYLLFVPFIHPHSALLNSIDHGKRSRSYDIPVE